LPQHVDRSMPSPHSTIPQHSPLQHHPDGSGLLPLSSTTNVNTAGGTTTNGLFMDKGRTTFGVDLAEQMMRDNVQWVFTE
jgi:hypothetical protein